MGVRPQEPIENRIGTFSIVPPFLCYQVSFACRFFFIVIVIHHHKTTTISTEIAKPTALVLVHKLCVVVFVMYLVLWFCYFIVVLREHPQIGRRKRHPRLRNSDKICRKIFSFQIRLPPGDRRPCSLCSSNNGEIKQRVNTGSNSSNNALGFITTQKKVVMLVGRC